MAADAEKSFRPWVAWLIGCVWFGTAGAVLIAVRIHPATVANISVNTRNLSFRTNATRILGPVNHEQLLISGMKSLQVRFTVGQAINIDGMPTHVTSLNAEGDSLSSCSFYRVRSGGFEIHGPAVLTLQMVESRRGRSFGLKAHGML